MQKYNIIYYYANYIAVFFHSFFFTKRKELRVKRKRGKKNSYFILNL